MVKKKHNQIASHVPPKSAAPIPPELLQQFLDNQSRELEIKTQELALRKQEDSHSFEFGKMAMDVQLEDRNKHREYNISLLKGRNWLVAFIASAILAVIIVSLYLNKDAVATEVIKALVFIFAGGVGGYGIAKNAAADEKEDARQDGPPQQ